MFAWHALVVTQDHVPHVRLEASSLLESVPFVRIRIAVNVVGLAQVFAQLVLMAFIWKVDSAKLVLISCAPFVLGLELVHAHHVKPILT